MHAFACASCLAFDGSARDDRDHPSGGMWARTSCIHPAVIHVGSLWISLWIKDGMTVHKKWDPAQSRWQLEAPTSLTLHPVDRRPEFTLPARRDRGFKSGQKDA